MNNEYDRLFQETTEKVIPGFDWKRIKAQAAAESGLLPGAVSPAGAIGVMQIMPATAEDMGIDPESLEDPETNIFAGISYMKHMLSEWSWVKDEWERWLLALASYNAGYGHVKAAWGKARRESYETESWACISPFLGKVTGRHARETINYVARIIRFYKRLQAAEREEE